MLHVKLPAGDVRDIELALGAAGIAAVRETVAKLVRGSVVLPARPRYRLSGSMSAPGGVGLRVRHGAGLVVARIGIGWRDHGASLVWAACGPGTWRSRDASVVDALDAAGVTMLSVGEAARLGQWVPVLANDLAWAATPPDAFSNRVLRSEEDHPWEVREIPRGRASHARPARERRRGGTLAAAEAPRLQSRRAHPRRGREARDRNPADQVPAAAHERQHRGSQRLRRLRSAATKVVAP